ncbi:hypothetical protein ACWATR_03875 [Nostoc sp. UIC 10890]
MDQFLNRLCVVGHFMATLRSWRFLSPEQQDLATWSLVANSRF